MAQLNRSTTNHMSRIMTFRQLLGRPFWVYAAFATVGLALLAILFWNRLNPDSFMASVFENWQQTRSMEQHPRVSSSEGLDPDSLPVLCGIQLRGVDHLMMKTNVTGKVLPKRVANLAFQRSGKITDVSVDEGAFVEANQVIAKLDQRHLNARQQQLQAELKQAEALMRELRQGPREEAIRAARAQVQDIDHQLQREQIQLARSSQLIEQNAISQQQHEQTLFGVRGLEAKLELATSQLDELLTGTRPEQIDAQAARVEAINSTLQSIEYDLEDCEILAPFAGQISHRLVDEGEIVQPGEPVCRLVEAYRLELHVGLPQDLATELTSDAVIQLYANDQHFTARIDSIINEVESVTQTVKAIVLLEDVSTTLDASTSDHRSSMKSDIVVQQPNLMAGQTVRVIVHRRISTAGFWVPTKALLSDHRGLWSCFVWRPMPTTDGALQFVGEVSRELVEVLHEENDWAFVRGTIDDGSWLISEGVHRLVHRQTVVLNPEISSTTLERRDGLHQLEHIDDPQISIPEPRE